MSDNPVLSAENVDGEVAIDRAIRPQYLKDYRGQPAVTEQLDIFIPAAKARNEALDHILFLVHRVWVKPHWRISWLTRWGRLCILPLVLF
jgi:hypothetical protein